MSRIAAFAVALAVLGASSARADLINIADANTTPTTVIGGSGDYSNGNFNTGGVFSTSNVIDGQNTSPDNTRGSTTTEPGQDGSYWLGRDGQFTGYFVLDLGSAQNIALFELYNTRNASYDDRGTGNFQITGANSLINLGAAGFDLDTSDPDYTILATGTLTAQTYPGPDGTQGNTPLVGNQFLSSTIDDLSATFRYLRFDALTYGGATDKGYGAAGIGLNEIRVFAAVPEPSTFALLGLGLATGAFVVVRRRKARALAA